MIHLPFPDRETAARELASALSKYQGTRPVVLGIPRGAVPMGRIIADALGGDLDVVLVRKLGAPENPELAIGAVDEHGSIMLNENASWVGANDAYVQREASEQLMLIRDRRALYGAGKAADLSGRNVIVVDDGLATGATMTAALKAVRAQHPKRLICAVPVAAPDSLRSVAGSADEVVCLATPFPFHAVGIYYRDFSPVSDEDVALALSASTDESFTPARPVRIPAGEVMLEGDLTSPSSPLGLVIFVHGSGSSRHSPRNRAVADVLNRHRISTLLFDLLTPQEDSIRASRFDIPLLTQRLTSALTWVAQAPHLRRLPIGLFGASTGAAAALCAAVAHPDEIATVVSRGGRPDLAGGRSLSQVRTPVLLIVGGADYDVLALNRAAQQAMGPQAQLAIVPGATHLFEEPGTLQEAALLAADWFVREFESIPET
ncbi:alpha/beta fold hydrolase [Lysobacter niabensis]|uniref:alpha/beta fold hydrolase n=1 Tax=Agrilutibacter niabensis TaxID=380628 RepID=UPI00360F6CB7